MIGADELGRRIVPQALVVEGDQAAFRPELARVVGANNPAHVCGKGFEAPVAVTACREAAAEVAQRVDEEALHVLRRQAAFLRVAQFFIDKSHVDVRGG